MRIPLDWLGELVELPRGITAEAVMAELVKVGFEEEAVHGSELVGPIVVGEVLEFSDEPQANGKTIRWCQLRVAAEGMPAADGGADVRGVVCGASNFQVGDKVVVTLPGAVLPGGFAISARKTYGHTSDGMIASSRELGLSEDHGGILLLSSLKLDPEVGVDAISLLGLGKVAAEVNVTPDRGYCLSLRGIAREFAHATHQSFSDPADRVNVRQVSGFGVEISDALPIRGQSGCDGFYALALEGVDATLATPQWMVSRLELAGMRSISIAVDISNYVMLELGHPNHTYDLDKLQGSISVRRARAGETFETLDGKLRTLDPEDLLITDEANPIGLAGVMGGASTEVSGDTKRVLIEAAHFDPISVARTARRHRLVSEASRRFERGVDTELAPKAAARVAELLIELTGARLVASATGGYLGAHVDFTQPRTPISLPKLFSEQLVGVSYSTEQISRTLTQIGCQVAEDSEAFQVTPPSWRPDLKHKTDLVEEVARLNGYQQIPSVIPVAPPGAGLTPRQQLRRRVVSALANSGLVEILNYPFVSIEELQQFDAATGAIRLENPMQEESAFLRTTLLPGLLSAAARNQSRAAVSLQVFEEGSVFLGEQLSAVDLPTAANRPSDEQIDHLESLIPDQPRLVSAVLIGDIVPQGPGQAARPADYSDAITAVKQVVAQASMQTAAALRFVATSQDGWHPGRTAEIWIGQNLIGVAGELHPDTVDRYHLKGRAAAFEIDLDQLFAAQPRELVAAELRIMPAATQDLTLIVPESVSAAELSDAIVEGAGELLESQSLIDIYRGAPLSANQKSITFALVFRATDRTLTQAEASEARDAAVALTAARFGAELRS